MFGKNAGRGRGHSRGPLCAIVSAALRKYSQRQGDRKTFLVVSNKFRTIKES